MKNFNNINVHQLYIRRILICLLLSFDNFYVLFSPLIFSLPLLSPFYNYQVQTKDTAKIFDYVYVFEKSCYLKVKKGFYN